MRGPTGGEKGRGIKSPSGKILFQKKKKINKRKEGGDESTLHHERARRPLLGRWGHARMKKKKGRRVKTGPRKNRRNSKNPGWIGGESSETGKAKARKIPDTPN